MNYQPDVKQQLSYIVKSILNRFRDDNSDVMFVESDIRKLYLSLNNAFLSALSGQIAESSKFLEYHINSPEYGGLVRFYLDGLNLVFAELDTVVDTDPGFGQNLQEISAWFKDYGENADISVMAEKSWTVFFPEAAGIYNNETNSIKDLRKERIVKITKLNQ